MVAVITGASRGVGRTLAFTLAKNGYNLALASRNIDDLERLKMELNTQFQVEIYIAAVDLSKRKESMLFAEDVIERFDTIDILINNVGSYLLDNIMDVEDELENNIATNLNSAFYISKKIAANMCINRKGHIFNICSVLSLGPRVEAASYTISKHALKGFNDVLREETRNYGVKVTAIYPGSINTSSWEGIIAPKEKFVQPEDIAESVLACLKISKNANIEEIVIKPLDKNF